MKKKKINYRIVADEKLFKVQKSVRVFGFHIKWVEAKFMLATKLGSASWSIHTFYQEVHFTSKAQAYEFADIFIVNKGWRYKGYDIIPFWQNYQIGGLRIGYNVPYFNERVYRCTWYDRFNKQYSIGECHEFIDDMIEKRKKSVWKNVEQK